jgi:hypothetical protein
MTNDFVANIFGMPPSKANRPPQDERQTINAIMGGLGFPSIYKPAEPAQVLADDPREALGQIMPGSMAAYAAFAAAIAGPVIDAPAPLDETPCAEDLAQTIADIRDVPLATAIRWLADRADEFKTLAESQK